MSETDLPSDEPPEGFEVMRESDLDPARGRSTHWLYHGRIGNRSFIRPGYASRDDACRAAWFVFRMVLPDDGRVVQRLAEPSAAGSSEGSASGGAVAPGSTPPNMREVYIIRLDTWEHMEGDLLSQVVDDAGSVRRASIVLDVPRSTLSARIRGHRSGGRGRHDQDQVNAKAGRLRGRADPATSTTIPRHRSPSR